MDGMLNPGDMSGLSIATAGAVKSGRGLNMWVGDSASGLGRRRSAPVLL